MYITLFTLFIKFFILQDKQQLLVYENFSSFVFIFNKENGFRVQEIYTWGYNFQEAC